MAEYSQKDRVFWVTTPLGKDELLLEGFSGREEISRPFHFSLDLLSVNASIDPTAILRKPVSVSIKLADGSDRIIHGVAARFTQLGRTEELTSYHAEIVPWLWFLSLSRDCRIFQAKSVVEIIKSVLDEYGDLEYDVRCVGSYSPREYCVQYRETDLAFVSRLMEEEGIFYFFEHSDSGHKLILADDPSAIPDCAQKEVEYSGSPGGWTDEDVITSVVREHSVYTTSVTLNDYDHLQPSLDLLSSAVQTSDDEIYDYPGKFTDTKAGERYASLRLEALSTTGERLRGTSQCRTFQSGHQFVLKDYFKAEPKKGCLLVSVTHTARGGGYRSRGDTAHYGNEFECVPVEAPYRPPRATEKPVVRGSQTAVIVGPSGEEIYTDEHGRVKVQFFWDRKGKKDENSSCWIRVSQPWAGKNWGAVTIPRIGQEVIIDFLEGDPDRPIVTGRVYNKIQTPPYALPANKTQTGIKSRSSKGGDGGTFNEIRMEDKKGEELLYVHAEKDKRVIVENDRSEEVGHDESIDIGNDRAEKVGNNENIGIGNDRSISVGNNESISVGGNQTEVVSDDQSISVGGNRGVDVGKNHSESIGGAMSLEIGKDRTLQVGANLTVKVGKAHKEETTKGYSLKAEEIFLEAKNQIEIKVGKAQIIMKKNGDIQIKGNKINIKGSGDVVVKGSKIAEN
jgi:type VI secretion system secreted protein VgrG